MTSDEPLDAGAGAATSYYAEIEHHFVQHRGAPLFITPKEWHLVAAWERDGVPLEVVLEAIDVVFERPRSRARRRTLAYCRQTVEATFRRFKEARFQGGSTDGGTEEGEGDDGVGDAIDELVGRLDRAADAEAASGRADGSVVEALRAAARDVGGMKGDYPEGSSGRAPLEDRLAELDTRLMEALERGVDEALRKTISTEAERSLESYRQRMPENVYETAVRSAFLRRLRGRFGLSRLSLF